MTTPTLTTPMTEPMTVRYLDLSVPDAQRRRLLDAMDRVLRHGRLILGPEVDELETRIAQFCGTKFAVGVSSGTGALYFALKAIGVGPGDEVVTTAMSFIATANAIASTGASPVFADVCDDLNIDPAAAEAAITPRTKAILPVHFTGRLCRMTRITAIGQRHGLPVIEDASQAFGAEHGGRRAGSFGLLGCISLNPMKILGACGEAGVVVTDRQDPRDAVVAMRYNGLVDRENCHYVSLNGRLDTLQAAILLERLAHVDQIIERRRQIAARYHEQLRGLVDVPSEHEGDRDVYYTYTIRTPRRDALKAFLEEHGIEAKVYHPRLMPEHEVYCGNSQGSWPNAQRLVRRILCLPAHEKLTDEQVDYVAACVRRFFGA